jgi:hypothetical protein
MAEQMRIKSRGAIIERTTPEPPPPPPPRWEYRSRLMDREADLSQWGADNWECYAVTAAGADQAVFYFRRRI